MSVYMTPGYAYRTRELTRLPEADTELVSQDVCDVAEYKGMCSIDGNSMCLFKLEPFYYAVLPQNTVTVVLTPLEKLINSAALADEVIDADELDP